ncbi:MAG: chloride channel protein [Hahellaceae bacterium]|nr:chloride channel protein [Hahellaceae bacterium]MCP5168515.1 chloride channel protein [Hahellaceae bacterium]
MLLRKIVESYAQIFRRRLASVDALPQLALLGLLSGTLTAAVILLFRWAIEWPLERLLPAQNPENFEALGLLSRFTLPFAGSILIAILWHRLQSHERRLGVSLVMERLNYHQGHISFRSALIQFAAGLITLTTGQSAGREGPAVHLGAACSSLLGQRMGLPNNSIRLLVGCGTAAAISASFNTPIAGVIFAMEVVMMEYSIAGFTPVILASVTAALITQSVLGAEPAFLVLQLNMNSLLEVPYVICLAVVIGCASAAFVKLITLTQHLKSRPIHWRILGAGVLTGLAAMLYPQIMGAGYDTVNEALFGQLPILTLLAIAVIKLVVTSLASGLGMPNGLVGPTLFIGATLGAAMGLLGAVFAPDTASSPGFYAMIGMGAMMGATLQAPLAALMALLELTQNPNIILPGMLAIVVSSMIASEVFKQKSVFLTLLKLQGLDYQNEPVLQALRRVGVGSIMERKFERANKQIDYAKAKEILKKEPRWILVDGDKCPLALLPAVDLARFLEEKEPVFKALENEQDVAPMLIDLLAMPAQRKDVASLHSQATLQEALDRFNETSAEALYIERISAPMLTSVQGVITKSDVESYYQYKRK